MPGKTVLSLWDPLPHRCDAFSSIVMREMMFATRAATGNEELQYGSAFAIGLRQPWPLGVGVGVVVDEASVVTTPWPASMHFPAILR